MNQIDSALRRLFQAAAACKPELPGEAPYSLETRLVNQWNSKPSRDHDLILAPIFRGAFLCACVIILISAALSVASLNETPPNEMVIVDSVIQLTLMQ